MKEIMNTRLVKKDVYKITDICGVAKRCDWLINNDGILKITNESNNIFLSSYLCKSRFPYFINKILPQIINPFNLIIASEDWTFPLGTGDIRCKIYSKYINLIKLLLDNPNFKKIYVENLDTAHPKMTPIPLGILKHSCNLVLNYNPIDFSKKSTRVFCCHRTYENNPYNKPQFVDRVTVSDYCKNEWKDMVTYFQNLNQNDFYDQMRSSMFTICVHGGGYDPSPRCWEALILGSIPIMEHSPLDEAYSRFPIVFVDKWSVDCITTDKLDKWLEELKQFYEDLVKRKQVVNMLSLDYWWDNVINT